MGLLERAKRVLSKRSGRNNLTQSTQGVASVHRDPKNNAKNIEQKLEARTKTPLKPTSQKTSLVPFPSPKVSQKVLHSITKQMKKEMTKHVDTPTITLQGAKIAVLRPKGAVPTTKVSTAKQSSTSNSSTPSKSSTTSKGRFDIKSIKESIQAELGGGNKKVSLAKGQLSRVSTGIPGLDGVMSGGFRTRTVNLVVGGPGSGKSTFAMQFLVNGVEQFNESGIYISFEQTQSQILKDYAQFGWNVQQKIKDQKIAFLTYTPEQVQKVLETGGGAVRDMIDSIGAKRIVIDSLTAFTLLYESNLAQRKACISLFESIKKWGCTALLISEQDPDPERRTPTVEEFEVDGVILLYNMRKGDIRERALEIFKMRGTEHSAKLFPLQISTAGLIIYPEQEVF